MTMELDVFVGNTTIMDEEVYQLWLDGYTVNDAVRVRMDGGVMEECEASADVLLSDTMDQYRTFQMCERLLHSPSKLGNQLLFQIPPHRQAMLIERYYTFDDGFVREVLGKKLSKGTKKDLDDIGAKTGVTLKSCRRQFDNFKRVFKVVEELKGPLVENIHHHFLLSDKLARDYAAIVFFANNRFETGKRKLQYLTFQDFAFCAGQLISNWTVGAVDNMVEDMDVDLDKEFLQDLKELKVLINDKDLLDQHKSLVCTALRGKTNNLNEMETNFKNLSRGLVNIAAKLTNAKDVRDLFIDLVEKFIEPCRSDRWTSADVRLYLTHYNNSVHLLDTFNYKYPACQIGRERRLKPLYGKEKKSKMGELLQLSVSPLTRSGSDRRGFKGPLLGANSAGTTAASWKDTPVGEEKIHPEKRFTHSSAGRPPSSLKQRYL